MSEPTFSVQRQPSCRIHALGLNHLHLAVCPACGLPLDSELRARCWHPDARHDGPRWRCIEGLA